MGLSIQQLQAFHWKGNTPVFAAGFEALRGLEHLNEAAGLRQLIQDADDTVTETELRGLWDAADYEISAVRLLGDVALSAFFEGTNDKTREARRRELATDVLNGTIETHRLQLEALRDADPPLVPFHWEIEFPEVFNRDSPGFDAIVGNPPFGGHVSVASSNLPGYTDWLRTVHVDTQGKCDVVAHFFRRSFDLIRQGGCLGLIATNTIAQGDTRTSGLRWICKNGGRIYHATRRLEWPGIAAVVVSVVNIVKGEYSGTFGLDGRPCEKITAFLFDDGGHDDPARLRANAGKCYVGSYVLGMGFTFDDTDQTGVASTISRMEELLRADARNQELIFPYVGGEEVNSHASHNNHRFIINFHDFPLKRKDQHPTWEDASQEQRYDYVRSGVVPADYPGAVASDWPELLTIVEAQVKPARLESSRRSKSSHGKRAAVWWQPYHRAHQLYAAIDGQSRVLVNSRVSHYLQLCFLPANMIYAESLIVYPFDTFAAFCMLQSRPNEIWAHFFGSSMKDDLRYTPSVCFDTFPFPEGWEALPDLEATGKAYYEFRSRLMIENDEGMTTTYNRFHGPDERDLRIAQLRDLHAAMDRAVFDAYGWHDISTECDFFLDYEIDEETWGNKKKPFRYRWPDHIRDEVLARLLKLNANRAAAEAREGHGEHGSTTAGSAGGQRRGPVAQPTSGSDTLF